MLGDMMYRAGQAEERLRKEKMAKTSLKNAVKASPEHRTPEGWSAPATAPWIDTVTNIEYPSRNALKKAVHTRLNKKNPIKQRQRDRLKAIVREIMGEGAQEARDKVKAESKAAAEAALARVDIPKIIEDIIRKEVRIALGLENDKGGTNPLTKFQQWMHDACKKHIEKEVLAGLTFDVRIGGHAAIHREGTRPLNLSDPADVPG